jgi:hypothetical protein
VPTPIYRQAATAVTSGSLSAASSAYSGALRVQQSALSIAGALLGDFRITGGTWSVAPTGGSIQLVAVDRDFAGTANSAPGSTFPPRFVGTFTPAGQTTATFGALALNAVALSPDCDYYVYNNGTGASLSTFTLTCTPWTPGT